MLTWLIAEDETDIRNLLDMMCQVWGHRTITFENGQKVWDWLDKVEGDKEPQVPELVLMDIRMPGKKGNEIATRMRQVDKFKKTPIVLMTAFALTDRERTEIMNENGVDHILNKPLPDFEQLRSILHGIVDNKLSAT
ncbi:MAG: response regulator [Anaerolineae bacterium]|nr:response regulator [Anaerolineae bacterium]MCA9907565.1 response regulator [Anaerolineae bacterium]